ncbi:MAG: rRNA pseudouridine synthase [Solobacterium sp.]|nr:rRNA pseudouridine synthase [Solobacterium sp.]
MRLDKALADMGIGTRSEIRKACKANRIEVNGEPVRDPSTHIDPEADEIRLDGEVIGYSKYVYFMLNKPAGTVSATRDDSLTVLDLVDCTVKGLYPVGRLDKDTEGLLLITNDGPLGHALLSPKRHVEKEYEVHVKDPLHEEDVQRIRDGLKVSKEETFLPAEVTISSDLICHVVLKEGKYHEVKRMFEAIGNEVVYLKRIRMKDLCLDPKLAPGEYRELTDEELASLKEA